MFIAAMLFIQSSLYSQENPSLSTLTVKGTATISKPADEMRINIGVVTQGETAERALKENSSKMEKIIKSLMQSGLEKGGYQTGRFNIRPIYSERPKSAATDWSPEIVGYEVTNTLFVKTEKIEAAGSLIDQVTKSGANSIDSIFFGLKEPHRHRTEAIEIATRNALQEAKTLSSAGGVSLVRIKSLSLDDAHPPMPRGQFYAKTMMAESAPIEAGEVDLTVTVTVQYEIQ